MRSVSDVAVWLAAWSPMTLAIVAKATVLLLLAVLISTVMRRASASARHLVWHLTLLALVALPVLSHALPDWQLPLPAHFAAMPLAATVTPTAAASTPSATTDANFPATARGASQFGGTRPAADDDDDASGGAGVSGGAAQMWARLGPGGIIYLVWAAGALAVLGWLLAGYLWIHRVASRSRLVNDGVWLRSVQELCGRLELRRPVIVLRSDAAVIPATCGLLWPALLLPVSADQWPESHRTSVLSHELAHVKRFDCLTQFVAQLACALFWFHPGVWYAARRLLEERERACDDMVLALGTQPSDYASHLIDIARALTPARLSAPATVSMARPSHLEGRLLAVLDPRRRRANPLRPLGSVPAIAMLGIVLPLSAIEAGAMPPRQSNTVVAATDSAAGNAAADRGAAASTDTATAPRVEPPTPTDTRAATEATGRRIRALAGDESCAATAEHTVTVPVADARRVRVEAEAGHLWIEGREDISDIRATGVACAADEDDLDEMRLWADRHRETVGIEARVGRHAHGARLHLLIEVPIGIAVDVEDSRGDTEIRDVGRLRIDDGSGYLHVERVRGSVRVEDGSDDIDIRSVDGSVTVTEDDGGDIRVAGVTGSFEVASRGKGLIDWLDVQGEVRVPRAPE